MKHVIIAPPPHLSQYVKCFWAFEVHNGESKQVQISTLVNNTAGITILMDNRKNIFKASVQGQFTQPQVFQPVSSLKVLGVVFYPHAINSLFGINAGELTDQELHLNNLAGWNMADALFNTQDVKRQIALIARFLTGLAAKAYPADGLINDCIHHIQVKKGLLTVAELQKLYAISERRLERRFAAAIGVSPRHYLKVTRFGEVLNLLKTSGNVKLTDIALALNYADQAHFIRHVKQLSGMIPTVLHKKLLEVPVNQVGCTPYLLGTVETGKPLIPCSLV